MAIAVLDQFSLQSSELPELLAHRSFLNTKPWLVAEPRDCTTDNEPKLYCIIEAVEYIIRGGPAGHDKVYGDSGVHGKEITGWTSR